MSNNEDGDYLEVTGTVEKITIHDEGTDKQRYGAKVDDGSTEEWYNEFGSPQVEEGDQVRIKFEETNYGNKIREIDIMDGRNGDEATRDQSSSDTGEGVKGNSDGRSKSIPLTNKDKRILIQVAFKEAAETMRHEEKEMDDELNQGEKLEVVGEYTNGYYNLLSAQIKDKTGGEQ